MQNQSGPAMQVGPRRAGRALSGPAMRTSSSALLTSSTLALDSSVKYTAWEARREGGGLTCQAHSPGGREVGEFKSEDVCVWGGV